MYDTIKEIIDWDYSVKIGQYFRVEKHTPVDFGTEQNYVLFLLR